MNVDIDCKSTVLSDELASSILERDVSLVILPNIRSDENMGVYGQSMLTVVKDLKALGIKASFLDSQEHRTFEVKKSTHEAIIQVSIVIIEGLAVNFIWDGVKAIFRRDHKPDQRMKFTYTNISANGENKSWTVEGPMEGVLTALDDLRDDENTDSE